MKKSILILCAAAAFAFVGCNKGGTGDQYNTSSGTSSSTNFTSMDTNLGAANSPSGTNTGSSFSSTNTLSSTNTTPPITP